MRMPLYTVLAVLISGCGMMGSSDRQARLDAMEQQVAVVIERLGTIEETNEEVMKNIEELSKDTSTDQRLSLLEEKQASVEKMQLELISYQESLKGSVNKMREYIEGIDHKVSGLVEKQEAEIAERRRRHLEERLRKEVDEDVQIQEIPRDKIIKIERPPAQPKIEERPSSPPLIEERISVTPEIEEKTPSAVEQKLTTTPSKKGGTVEGGFILEDF